MEMTDRGDQAVLRKIQYAMRKETKFDEESASSEAQKVLSEGKPDEVLMLRVRSGSSYYIEEALPLSIENLRKIDVHQ